MCGRFTQTNSDEAVAALLARILGRVALSPEDNAAAGAHAHAGAPPLDPPQQLSLAPRVNIAPMQPVGIITSEGGIARRRVARWGMLRGGRPKPGRRPIDPTRRPFNARIETANTLPTFRDAWQRRRCLIVADGWYEWQKVAGRRAKQPWHLWPRLADDGRRAPFVFAGLWSIAELPSLDGPRHHATFAVVTTEPAPAIAHIHDRMPLVLREDHAAAWLDGGPPGEPRTWTARCHELTFHADAIDGRVDDWLTLPTAPSNPAPSQPPR